MSQGLSGSCGVLVRTGHEKCQDSQDLHGLRCEACGISKDLCTEPGAKASKTGSGRIDLQDHLARIADGCDGGSISTARQGIDDDA